MAELTASQVDLLTAARRHQLLRLPSGETRRYFDDGTYTSAVGARAGELEAAGLLRVGMLHTPTNRVRHRFHELEPTTAALALLDGGVA